MDNKKILYNELAIQIDNELKSYTDECEKIMPLKEFKTLETLAAFMYASATRVDDFDYKYRYKYSLRMLDDGLYLLVSKVSKHMMRQTIVCNNYDTYEFINKLLKDATTRYMGKNFDDFKDLDELCTFVRTCMENIYGCEIELHPSICHSGTSYYVDVRHGKAARDYYLQRKMKATMPDNDLMTVSVEGDLIIPKKLYNIIRPVIKLINNVVQDCNELNRINISGDRYEITACHGKYKPGCIYKDTVENQYYIVFRIGRDMIYGRYITNETYAKLLQCNIAFDMEGYSDATTVTNSAKSDLKKLVEERKFNNITNYYYDENDVCYYGTRGVRRHYEILDFQLDCELNTKLFTYLLLLQKQYNSDCDVYM
jgi:hypothetical protein